jgi:hypothetical protein
MWKVIQDLHFIIYVEIAHGETIPLRNIRKFQGPVHHPMYTMYNVHSAYDVQAPEIIMFLKLSFLLHPPATKTQKQPKVALNNSVTAGI